MYTSTSWENTALNPANRLTALYFTMQLSLEEASLQNTASAVQKESFSISIDPNLSLQLFGPSKHHLTQRESSTLTSSYHLSHREPAQSLGPF